MGRADTRHDKRSNAAHLLQRELASEVSMKLIECHVCNGRCERVNDEISRFQMQLRFSSRPVKLNQGKVIKANTGCHTIANGIVQRGSSLRDSGKLNIEGPSKPASDEGCDFDSLDFKSFGAQRRRNRKSIDES